MKNNKGFSLVELLGVITILGILMTIAILAYSRYIASSKNKSYKALREAAISATEEYIMDEPDATSPVTFKYLVDNQFLENATDPSDKTKQCRGRVEFEEKAGTAGALDSYDYTVIICCANYNHTYTTSNKKDLPNNKCALD